MKDQVALLIAGVACAALAWTFWHFLGANAFNVLSAIFMVNLIIDNRRLRAQLRQRTLE